MKIPFRHELSTKSDEKSSFIVAKHRVFDERAETLKYKKNTFFAFVDMRVLLNLKYSIP